MAEQKNYSKIVNILAIVFIALSSALIIGGVISLLIETKVIEVKDLKFARFLSTYIIGGFGALIGIIPLLQGVFYLKKPVQKGELSNKTLSIILLVFGPVMILGGILCLLSWVPIQINDLSGVMLIIIPALCITLIVFEALIVKGLKGKKIAPTTVANNA